jgi:hypothetical protein
MFGYRLASASASRLSMETMTDLITFITVVKLVFILHRSLGDTLFAMTALRKQNIFYQNIAKGVILVRQLIDNIVFAKGLNLSAKRIGV